MTSSQYFSLTVKIALDFDQYTWGDGERIQGGVSLLADISQFPITHLVFPFAIPTLEGPTYFSRFHRGTSFKKEEENPSLNSETFHLFTGGNVQDFCSSKATGVLLFKVINPKRCDEGALPEMWGEGRRGNFGPDVDHHLRKVHLPGAQLRYLKGLPPVHCQPLSSAL